MEDLKEISEFDYSGWTETELEELYHAIIDAAIEDGEYRRHVRRKWNISIEEFWTRVMHCKMQRIGENIKKKEIKQKILTLLREKWKHKTKEEVKRNCDYLWAEANYRSRN